MSLNRGRSRYDYIIAGTEIMAIRLLGWGQRNDTGGELRLDGELLGLAEGAETLEQKVARLFQKLRRPVYLPAGLHRQRGG